MTSTIPTTLADYQEFVRKEALQIQKDMGWPDDKLNSALKALGLPEKVTFRIPVEVTARMIAVITVEDAETEEAARKQVAEQAGDDLRLLLRGVGVQTGSFHADTATLMPSLPTTFEVGDPDTTMANQSVSRAYRGERYCETYDSTGRHYCTRRHGHEDGRHAMGNGSTISAAWDA